MPEPTSPTAPVHHTITGLFSTCRTKLRASDAAILLTWEGVTCAACLAPAARRRAEVIIRADVLAWGPESMAWPVREQVAS